jgi:hypothetical protein
MNLYVLKFIHYSPKDSKEGIITYLCTDSDEQIYEWLKSEPEVNGKHLFNSYKDNENDEKIYNLYDNRYNCIGTETFKEHMIRFKGEMFDEEAEVLDAYYGVTHYGWELVSENIYYTDVIATRNNLKINIIDIN